MVGRSPATPLPSGFALLVFGLESMTFMGSSPPWRCPMTATAPQAPAAPTVGDRERDPPAVGRRPGAARTPLRGPPLAPPDLAAGRSLGYPAGRRDRVGTS